MTNFLHWRKMTWALVLWSGYIATWAVVTGSEPALVTVWWLVGLVVFRPLWFATKPLALKGRSLDGFVRPDWTHWRVVTLHRANRDTETRHDAG